MSAALNTQPLRVVIIDDTEDLRGLLSLAMVRGGFDVVGEAGDGREGIEVVRSGRPDVVLLDLSMPVMDGLEALPTIRRLAPHAKIIVLSGFGATQMSARAMASGADGYVQKGASLDSLLDYVRDMTAGVPARSPRSLTVVPPVQESESLAQPSAQPSAQTSAQPSTEPSPAGLDRPAPQQDAPVPTRTEGSSVSAWQALAMAPMGILELTDEPLFRVVFANQTAQRLLGGSVTAQGTPLSAVSSQLATLVAFHRLDADASFEVELAGATVRASLRRTGWSLLVYLDSTSDDVGMLRRAIATTAHEIRGPVAVICGIAEASTWSAEELPEAQRSRLMSSVARQARLLDSITADLLTAAQIQRGTLRIDLQEVSPQQVVDSVVGDRYDVGIEVVVEDSRPVRADAVRLEQMISNLVGNAVKYGQAPYRIRIRPNGDAVAIDVIDHGPGVPPEFTDELFREFTRAQGTVATGSGLGLFVVRTLAEAQSGSIGYQPGPYGGAVFSISLTAF